jgi:PAS domain S-box-containing protein
MTEAVWFGAGLASGSLAALAVAALRRRRGRRAATPVDRAADPAAAGYGGPLFPSLAGNPDDDVEASGSALWVWTPETDRLVVADRVLEMTGYTRHQVDTRLPRLVRYVHPDDLGRVRAIFADYLERRSAECETELRVRRADGRYLWVHTLVEATWDGAGRVLRVAGLLTDISQRIEAEEERDRLFNLSVDMLAVVGYDQRLQQANPAWVRVLGWSRDDLMAASITSFAHPDDRVAAEEAFARMRESEVVEGFECRLACRDGTYRWLSFNAFPYRDRRVIFTVARDITAHKAAERQRLETQERLRSLSNQLALVEDRQRRDLAAAIHDGLAQQLFGLRAQITLLKYPEKLENHQEVVARTIEILDETMTQARTLSFELFPPVLYEVGLEAALQWLTHAWGERTGIACAFAAAAPETELPEDSRAMAYQCVRELLANAHKHAGASRVEVSMADAGTDLVLRVADDGRGFDPAVERRSGQDDVAGFGLFSIRERLSSIGGVALVDSAPGAGTRIELRFPVDPAAARAQEPG